jgi:ABC-type transport system involved in multi-copper enzyme maturation permease subunit
MTALTVPVGQDRELRPVPWRKMAWVTWRQHRTALAGLAALLGAGAVYLLIMGLSIHHAYAAVTACHPARSGACGNLVGNFLTTYWGGAQITSVLLQLVPVLIGAFVGAPVLARELETGTFRFIWTQGFGRARWAAAKLTLLAVAVTAAAGAFSVLYAWYIRPFLAAAVSQQSSLAGEIFDLKGIAFAAWTLAAFAIGALAGLLIRRVVPAMAATLAVYAGLAFATTLWLRQHYLAPLVTSNPGGPPGPGNAALPVSQWYTGANGKPASQAVINHVLQGFQPAVTKVGPNSFQTNISPQQYLAQHGYTQWMSYQPASRFWPFQWIEGGWLLALSVLLIAATVWLVRRRAA